MTLKRRHVNCKKMLLIKALNSLKNIRTTLMNQFELTFTTSCVKLATNFSAKIYHKKPYLIISEVEQTHVS